MSNRNNSNTNSGIRKLVFTALVMAMILVATSLFRIPVPMTQGYVHLGDAVIFLGVLLLGKRNGALAAGLGSAMGDVLGGYAFFAPCTFIVKFLMAFVCGLIIEKFLGKNENSIEGTEKSVSGGKRRAVEMAAMTAGGLVMVAGYFLGEIPIYGNVGTALAEIPWNIGQFLTGEVVAMLIAVSLSRTPAKKYFSFPL